MSKVKFALAGNNGSAITPDAIKNEAVRLSTPKYKQAQVDLSIDVPEPIPVLKHGDRVIFSRGDISVIGGRAKCGKTFLIVLLAVDFLNFSDTGKLLIVDTEMGKARAYRTTRRIHNMMGLDLHRNNERLTTLSLREHAAADRVAIFKEAIEAIRPELIFLDGVRDFVSDFNKVDEATETVGMLMRLSVEYDCHICCVLHENVSDGKLRGHVGTEIANKSETVMGVIKNDNTSTVEPKYTRCAPFDRFSFRINVDGLPEYCDMPVKSAKAEKMCEVFGEAFSNATILSYSDLGCKIMEVEGISKPTANRRIKEAFDVGVIVKNQRGDYYLSKPINDENTLPF